MNAQARAGGEAVGQLNVVVKTVAASGTPERVSATHIFFRSATFYGKNAYRTNNTGSVYLGTTSTNNEQHLEITPGGVWVITAPRGMVFDLYDLYLDVATNADGVLVEYDSLK